MYLIDGFFFFDPATFRETVDAVDELEAVFMTDLAHLCLLIGQRSAR